MTRISEQPSQRLLFVQTLSNLSGKGRPNKARKPSHIEPFVIEQLAFPSAQGFSLREKREELFREERLCNLAHVIPNLNHGCTVQPRC